MVYLLTHFSTFALMQHISWLVCCTGDFWTDVKGVKILKNAGSAQKGGVTKSNKCNKVEDNELPIIQKNSENDLEVEEKGEEEEYNPAESNC